MSAAESESDAACEAQNAVAEQGCANARPCPTEQRLQQLEAELSGHLTELAQLFGVDGVAHLAQQRAAHAAQEAELQRQRQRLKHALRFADQQQAEVDAQRLRLRSQRRRVGAALKQKRAELREQLEQFHEALATQSTDSVRSVADCSAADSIAVDSITVAANRQIAELVRERDALLLRVEESQSGSATAVVHADDDKTYELRRRFEMAVEDMRAYKHRVAELEELLAQQPKPVEKKAATGPLNWAQQKANMLASLETDMAGTDPKCVEDRLTVEGTVRITDEIVAEKDREIVQLLRQIDELRAERATSVAHDSGVASILDHDAVISAERERLRKLQESVLDKQRAAEVELSMERAKLARQRVEMENRLHALESDLAHRQSNSVGSDNAAPVSRSLRGRWLSRLGLKDGDAGS